MAEIRYITDLSQLDRMMEIERLSFITPWSRQDVRQGLSMGARARFLGIFEQDTLMGWGCVFMGMWEAHLATLSVHPHQRRRGLGRELLKGLMQAAADAGAAYMELECRVNNKAARHMYESEGFVQAGVRQGYYSDTGEDAIIYVNEHLPEGDSENDPFLIRE